MKYYPQLAELKCFTRGDVMEFLHVNRKMADYLVDSYLQKGYIKRIRSGMYATLDLTTKEPIANKFQIATHLRSDAIVFLTSALEYYGLLNQTSFVVYVTTQSSFPEFQFEDITYVSMKTSMKLQTQENNGVRVTTLEQTIVDCLARMKTRGDLEELWQALSIVGHLDGQKLLEILDAYDSDALYQKVGYLFEQIDNKYLIDQSFLDKYNKHVSSRKYLLTRDEPELSFDKRWQLYVPPIDEIVNKGVDINAI